MALEILQNNEMFFIDGDLNQLNVSKFNATFSDVFLNTSKLVINIENLRSADVAGVSAFEALYRESIKYNRRLELIGHGSRDLYHHFQTNSIAS